MFYAMRKYNLFNVRVIGAQLVVFTLWTFTFFRLLLDTSARDTLPDLVLFIIVLILGVLLLRSVFMEAKTQREFAVLAVDHAKSEFVTIAAHELRTPLSAVRWAFGLLLSDQDHPLSPEQRDILMKGNKAADRMMDLSNDFLNIAHMAEGKFTFDLEPGDIRTAARVALEAFEDPAKQKNISLSIECSESMPSVTFDRSKLTMAIENLIDNAIKYTPQNGAVLLRVCHDDKTASIAVSDTGIGISPDELEHSFEKFFRGKRAVQMFTDGSGLGLFITKTIVEGHGGTISIGAHEGGGTTITIALPVARYWSRNVS
jgi:signal transduction histidine kinase